MKMNSFCAITFTKMQEIIILSTYFSHFICRLYAENINNLCTHACQHANANPQIHMQSHRATQTHTTTGFIIKRHKIIQMCGFLSCPRTVGNALQNWVSLCISNFSLKSLHSLFSPLHSSHERIRKAWSRPEANHPTSLWFFSHEMIR